MAKTPQGENNDPLVELGELGPPDGDVIQERGFRLRLPRRRVLEGLGLLVAAAAGGGTALLAAWPSHNRAKLDAERSGRQAGVVEGRRLEGARGERAAEEAARLTELLNRGQQVPGRLLNGTLWIPSDNGQIKVANPIWLRPSNDIETVTQDPAEAWWGVQVADALGKVSILPKRYDDPGTRIELSSENQAQLYLRVGLKITQVRESDPPRDYFAAIAYHGPEITVLEQPPAREILVPR